MSPERERIEIKTATTGKREVVVNGHEFEMDFDDAALLRDILEVSNAVETITNDEDATTQEKLAKLTDLSQRGITVIDQALGAGAAVTIFGEGKLPLLGTFEIVTKLAIASGPAYDDMFKEYMPPVVPTIPKQPSPADLPKIADAEYGRELTTRTWVIETDDLDSVIGGN